jgi:hypothetical protein
MLVLALMVVAKGITTSFGRALIEPDFREQATYRLDPHGGCARSLVGDHGDVELSITQMISVAKSGDSIRVDAVVRQKDQSFLIAARPQLGGVVAEDLALAFDVVEHSDLLSHELDDPDGARIRLLTGATDVPIQANRKQRIASDLTDASLLTSLG